MEEHALRQALPESWAFWRDWYQDALDGVPPDWDMLTEIALIDPDDWDRGPGHVNPMIDRIVEKYRLLKEVRVLKAEISALRSGRASLELRGDNHPPELVEEETEAFRQVEIIWASLEEAEEELEKPAPDPGLLKRAGQAIWNATKALGKYVAGLGDAFLKKAAEEGGGAFGKWGVRMVAGYFIVQELHVLSLAKRIIEYASKLVP